MERMKRIIPITDAIDLARDAEVRKSNVLIQKAHYALGARSQKVVAYLISQINPGQEEFTPMTFSIQEFCRLCGIDESSGKNYNDLKATLLELCRPFGWVRTAPKKEKAVSWIEKPVIDFGNGTVQIIFDNGLKSYLLQLREKFTVYELRFILRMRSKYSIRMYELVKSLHFSKAPADTFEFTYDLQELKELLDAENYKTWQHFSERVLTPATADINQFTDKNLSVTPVKTRRAITHIRLVISNKDTMEVIRVRDAIDKALGPEQMTIWGKMLSS